MVWSSRKRALSLVNIEPWRLAVVSLKDGQENHGMSNRMWAERKESQQGHT